MFFTALKRISFALLTAEVIFISGLVSLRFLFTVLALSFAQPIISATYLSAFANIFVGTAIFKILNTFNNFVGLTA
jgi:hypothetical protein